MAFADILSGIINAFRSVISGIGRLASFLFGSISQFFSQEQIDAMPEMVRELLEAPLIVLPLSVGMIGFVIYMFVLWFIP